MLDILDLVHDHMYIYSRLLDISFPPVVGDNFEKQEGLHTAVYIGTEERERKKHRSVTSAVYTQSTKS